MEWGYIIVVVIFAAVLSRAVWQIRSSRPEQHTDGSGMEAAPFLYGGDSGGAPAEPHPAGHDASAGGGHDSGGFGGHDGGGFSGGDGGGFGGDGG